MFVSEIPQGPVGVLSFDSIEKNVPPNPGALQKKGYPRSCYPNNNYPIPSRELTKPFPKACLKMLFIFPRWDMLVPWKVTDLEPK